MRRTSSRSTVSLAGGLKARLQETVRAYGSHVDAGRLPGSDLGDELARDGAEGHPHSSVARGDDQVAVVSRAADGRQAVWSNRAEAAPRVLRRKAFSALNEPGGSADDRADSAGVDGEAQPGHLERAGQPDHRAHWIDPDPRLAQDKGAESTEPLASRK